MISLSNIRALLIPGALLALAACEAPGDLVIPNEALDVFDGVSAEAIIGQPSTATLFATFEQICVNNLDRLTAVPAQLQANGYTLLARDNEITMFASPEASRPIVGLAGPRPSNPEFCMVLAPDTQTNRSAFARYLDQRPGNQRFEMQIPGAEAVYINPVAGEIFITVRERDAQLGDILGVGVGGT